MAALTEGSHDGRPVNLRQFVHDADWLNRGIPTFDEFSFGLPRLMAAGLLTVRGDAKDGLLFSATTKAIGLRDSVKAKTLGGVIVGMEQTVGARPVPQREAEDRTLDRLPGLEPEALASAIREHGDWVMRWTLPFVVAIRAVSWLVSRLNRKS